MSFRKSLCVVFFAAMLLLCANPALADAIPPTAVSGSFSVVPNTPTFYTVSGLDMNSPPSPITFILVSGSAHGSMQLNADGTGVYTPQSGYLGPDSFSFQVENGLGLLSAVATESILVTTTSATPEPASLMLLASGLAATAGFVRRRRVLPSL